MRVFGAKVGEGVGGGGVAGKDDEVIGLVEVVGEGVLGEGGDFEGAAGAVGGIGVVDDFGDFDAGDGLAKMIGENFATSASIEDNDLFHMVYYTYVRGEKEIGCA